MKKGVSKSAIIWIVIILVVIVAAYFAIKTITGQTFNSPATLRGCTEDDGGKVANVPGTNVLKFKEPGSTVFFYQNISDSCVNATSVKEYSCGNNSVGKIGYYDDIINCAANYVCKNDAKGRGYCGTSAPLYNTCVDSDGGQNFTLRGSVNFTNTQGGTFYGTDFCTSANNLTEYYCFDIGGGNKNYGVVGFNCSSLGNYVCSNGACVYSPPSQVCGNGIIEGTEQCDGANLNGQTCASRLGAGYTGTLSCSNCTFNTAACIAPTPIAANCTDTDGPYKYGYGSIYWDNRTWKGTANYTVLGSGINMTGCVNVAGNYSCTDFCSTSQNLTEYYCNSTQGAIVSKRYSCSSCSNGACPY